MNSCVFVSIAIVHCTVCLHRKERCRLSNLKVVVFICEMCVAGSISHTDAKVSLVECDAVVSVMYSGFEAIAIVNLAIRVFQPFSSVGCLRGFAGM